jgi:hypothetical protein
MAGKGPFPFGRYRLPKIFIPSTLLKFTSSWMGGGVCARRRDEAEARKVAR